MSFHRRLLPVLVLFGLGACSGGTSFTVEMSRDELQSEIEKKFPLQPTSEGGRESPMDLTISNPVVLLEEGKSQIGLRVDVVGEPKAPRRPDLPLPGRPRGGPDGDEPAPRFTAIATFYASIRYDQASKSIRLSEAKITSLQSEQLPKPLEQALSRIAEKALEQRFAEKPIPLKNETALDQAVATFLKSVTVKDGKLLVEIGW